MDRKLMLRCWRIANSACEQWQKSLAPAIKIYHHEVDVLRRLDKITTTTIRHHKIIQASPVLFDQFRSYYTKYLSRIGNVVEFIDLKHRLKPCYWTANYANGLYQLIDKESVNLSQYDLTFIVEGVNIEGVHLGDFKVTLPISVTGGFTPLTIRSLDNPDCARAHPHIQNTVPCLGDAKISLDSAWETGDIVSVLDIMDSYLRSYDLNSAYWDIEQAGMDTCEDCGHEGNNMLRCDACESTSCCAIICVDCGYTRCSHCASGKTIACNGCSDEFCSGCIASCSVCDYTMCTNCMETCELCGLQSCPDCLKDGICESCSESILNEKKTEEELNVNAK